MEDKIDELLVQDERIIEEKPVNQQDNSKDFYEEEKASNFSDKSVKVDEKSGKVPDLSKQKQVEFQQVQQKKVKPSEYQSVSPPSHLE